MPLIDSVHYEPDEAIAKGHCPECGKPLSGVNIDDEIKRHWHSLPSMALANPEIGRRAEMLSSYAAKLKAAQAHQASPDPLPDAQPAAEPAIDLKPDAEVK